jgi:hypothetical protein
VRCVRVASGRACAVWSGAAWARALTVRSADGLAGRAKVKVEPGDVARIELAVPKAGGP